MMNLTTKKLKALCVAGLSVVGTYAQEPGWLSVVTDEVGLSGESVFCISVADLNNDSYPDLAVIKGGWSTTAENTIRLYLNTPDVTTGKRKFIDITDGSGVNDRPGGAEPSRGTLVIALADVNNDGNIDLVRGNYYHRLVNFTDQGDRCEVLLGNGKGQFTLVPNNGLNELGLVNAIGLSFLDYDKDGNIDLFIANYSKDHDNNIWTPGYLMKGNGDGTFQDVTAAAGINQSEPMYGSTVVDWNNDGWPDIVTAPYCRTNGKLWRNNGNGTFTNVAAEVGYNARYMQGDGGQNLCMWSNVPEDYDNDGDIDFFFSLVHGGTGFNEGRSTIVVNGGAANGYKLSVNRDITVRNTPMSDHLGDYDASWFDLDNDGKMDLAMAQGYYQSNTDRLYVFHQKNPNHLEDITGAMGMIVTETNNLHLLEVMDYDLDGDDDIIYCRDAAPQQMHLLRNEKGQDNNWVGFKLSAPQGVNKSCIGARIHLWSGGVSRMREIYAGRGNASGQQPFHLLFGLGSNATVDSVKVVWPDAANSETVFYNPPVNQYHLVTRSGLAVENEGGLPLPPAMHLYPNPAKDKVWIHVDGAQPIAKIEVYNVFGQLVLSREEPGLAGIPISVAPLSAGRYFVRVSTYSGVVMHASFVRQ
jgi:hypothetical protein